MISALFETVEGFPLCQVTNYVKGSAVVPIQHVHGVLARFDVLLKIFDKEVNVTDDNTFLFLESLLGEGVGQQLSLTCMCCVRSPYNCSELIRRRCSMLGLEQCRTAVMICMCVFPGSLQDER